MREQPIGRAAAALLALALLILAAAVVWWTLDTAGLRARLADTQISLDTNRQRERKQQTEYDAAASALPEVQAELDALQPQTDAAVATETDLRAKRKQARTDNADLADALTAARTAAEEAEARLPDAQARRDAALEELRALAGQAEEALTTPAPTSTPEPTPSPSPTTAPTPAPTPSPEPTVPLLRDELLLDSL